jgi:hypothetical protein
MKLKRREKWVAGLLFAFLLGLTVSKPPVSSASLREDFPSYPSLDIAMSAPDDHGPVLAGDKDYSSPDIDVSARDDHGSVLASENDCRDVSSPEQAQELFGSPDAGVPPLPDGDGAACEPMP